MSAVGVIAIMVFYVLCGIFTAIQVWRTDRNQPAPPSETNQTEERNRLL